MTTKLSDIVKEKIDYIDLPIDDNDTLTLQLLLLINEYIKVDDFVKIIDTYKQNNIVLNYDILLLYCCYRSTNDFNSHIEYLILQGANINSTDNAGMSCLLHLGRNANIECIKKVINNGANIFSRSHKMEDIYFFLNLFCYTNGIKIFDENSDDEEIDDDSTSKNSFGKKISELILFIRQKELEILNKLYDTEKKYNELIKIINGKGISIEI